jgi:flavin-dependent dehydrogenase
MFTLLHEYYLYIGLILLRERLKVTNIVEGLWGYQRSWKKSFGKNVKRPPSRIALWVSTKRTTRNRMTKMKMENLRPSWESYEQALTT